MLAFFLAAIVAVPVQEDPTTAASYKERGEKRLKTGDLKGAVEDFTRAIKLAPRDVEAHIKRAKAFREMREMDKALQDYDSAIAIDPRSADTYYFRSQVHCSKGNYQTALEDCNTGLKLAPADSNLYIMRSFARELLGDYSGAMVDANKAIEANPRSPWAYWSRGFLGYDLRQWKAALVDFTKAAGLFSTQRDDLDYTHLRMWILRTRLGDGKGADQGLRAYMKKRGSPTDDDWLGKVISFFLNMLREEELFKAAESKHPQIAREQKCEAYFYAGVKRLLAGDKATAERYFQDCLGTGIKDFTEILSARSELKALKE